MRSDRYAAQNPTQRDGDFPTNRGQMVGPLESICVERFNKKKGTGRSPALDSGTDLDRHFHRAIQLR